MTHTRKQRIDLVSRLAFVACSVVIEVRWIGYGEIITLHCSLDFHAFDIRVESRFLTKII